MRALLSVAALLLTACQDYNLSGPEDQPGKYNPPDLSPERHTDAITQVTVPAVDVLFVIDNSCSMEEEQRALRQSFPEFMRYFTGSGLDYHVGVVSTDMDRSNRSAGILIGDSSGTDAYIDASYSEADAVDSFSDRASLGTLGSGTEKGKDAAWAALVTNANAENAGFYRQDADLSIIVISDERDQSTDVSVNEFINWALGLKPDGAVYFSSIVGPSPNGCNSANGNAEAGIGYLEVTERVGGIEWSICESDWSDLLAELGLLAAGLKHEFFLSLVPVVDTIEVSVTTPDGSEVDFAPEDWTYSGVRNSITFVSYLPEPLSVVHITYDVLASSEMDPAGTEAPPTSP